MNCASCGAQVPAAFGHAIRKNECPACGSVLMDEESMAIVEELRGFVLQTVKVREETADTLALALVAAYQISGRGDAPRQPVTRPSAAQRPKTGASVQRAEEETGETADGEFVKASDLFDPNSPLSKEEREAEIQRRIEERLMTQAMIPSKVAARVATAAGAGRMLTDRELAESPILEAQRLARLERQEANRMNNPSSMCSPVSRRDET